jgi:MoaA/NifB/PqqE/SkfB family radical SAM enzyme
MSLSTLNYGRNLVRLWRQAPWLYPQVVTYYVTTRCNLNCVYCEDFGARRNDQASPSLELGQAVQLLRLLRRSVDSVILTGGEPLLYPDIVALVTCARRELKFREITLLTNSVLLPHHEALLPALHRLVVSVDAADPAQWSTIIQAPESTAQAIFDNLRRYAQRQRELGYRLIVNCVLTPETLPAAEGVLEFCQAHNLLISFSPQAVRNWPRYDLLVSEDYRAFIRRLLALKKQGAPILGSQIYLRTLLEMQPYACYPTLAPRIMPSGDLVYPCRPIEKEGRSHGGRPCNLLAVGSLERALEIAQNDYGPPPRLCASCFQQCYAEPSLMQAQPLALLSEWLRYPASRQGGLASYAPG